MKAMTWLRPALGTSTVLLGMASSQGLRGAACPVSSCWGWGHLGTDPEWEEHLGRCSTYAWAGGGWCGAAQCHVVQCNVVQRDVAQRCAVWRNVMQYNLCRSTLMVYSGRDCRNTHLSVDSTVMDSLSLRLSDIFMKFCFYWSGLVKMLVKNQISWLANCCSADALAGLLEGTSSHRLAQHESGKTGLKLSVYFQS